MAKLEKSAGLAERTFRHSFAISSFGSRHFALLSRRGALQPASGRMSDKVDNGAGAPPRRKGFLRPEGGPSPDRPVPHRHLAHVASFRDSPIDVRTSSFCVALLTGCATTGQ
jgi:hypothetical protein